MTEENERTPATRDPFADVGFGTPWSALIQSLARDWPGRLGDLSQAPAVTMPSVDVTETEEEYCVRAELPGVDKDDVAVELHDGVLELRGEKKSRRDESTERGRLLECSYGAFSRRFSLPSDADVDRIHAGFKDGVLEIRIAKQPESKPRQIAVKS